MTHSTRVNTKYSIQTSLATCASSTTFLYSLSKSVKSASELFLLLRPANTSGSWHTNSCLLANRRSQKHNLFQASSAVSRNTPCWEFASGPPNDDLTTNEPHNDCCNWGQHKLLLEGGRPEKRLWPLSGRRSLQKQARVMQKRH